MAHTFEELVEKQRTADQAHAQVLALRDEYGRPAQEGGWSEDQTAAYNKAWEDWRDAAVAIQAAVTDHAEAESRARNEVEADVKRHARHPELVST
ncbi:hypothetical protein K4B79_18725 [Streptomyces lincolnensis]|uniref:hypothetical protein n=1 Tax=Streptomyces lincolnensis TaxID=1915 RepID=UPI001E437AAF|nr:hypothetical protein [Streptomyces lincolnensis]MCD7440250.1 hypothetical protein [Streptomyces lincolnensis]